MHLIIFLLFSNYAFSSHYEERAHKIQRIETALEERSDRGMRVEMPISRITWEKHVPYVSLFGRLVTISEMGNLISFKGELSPEYNRHKLIAQYRAALISLKRVKTIPEAQKIIHNIKALEMKNDGSESPFIVLENENGEGYKIRTEPTAYDIYPFKTYNRELLDSIIKTHGRIDYSLAYFILLYGHGGFYETLATPAVHFTTDCTEPDSRFSLTVAIEFLDMAQKAYKEGKKTFSFVEIAAGGGDLTFRVISLLKFLAGESRSSSCPTESLREAVDADISTMLKGSIKLPCNRELCKLIVDNTKFYILGTDYNPQLLHQKRMMESVGYRVEWLKSIHELKAKGDGFAYVAHNELLDAFAPTIAIKAGDGKFYPVQVSAAPIGHTDPYVLDFGKEAIDTKKSLFFQSLNEEVSLETLPEGSMFTYSDEAYLLVGKHLLDLKHSFSHASYRAFDYGQISFKEKINKCRNIEVLPIKISKPDDTTKVVSPIRIFRFWEASYGLMNSLTGKLPHDITYSVYFRPLKTIAESLKIKFTLGNSKKFGIYESLRAEGLVSTCFFAADHGFGEKALEK